MADVDDVLAELQSLGALGVEPPAASQPEARVEDVEVEQGAPGAVLRDLRGPRMVDLLDESLRRVKQTMEGLDGLRVALEGMRQIWANPEMPVADAEATEEAPQEVLETPQTVAQAAQGDRKGQEVATPSEHAGETPAGPADPEDPVYQKAREAALRKIQGKDIPEELIRRAQEEEDVPFVGQTRVTKGNSSGETTVGTLGTIKPSFPKEEN